MKTRHTDPTAEETAVPTATPAVQETGADRAVVAPPAPKPPRGGGLLRFLASAATLVLLKRLLHPGDALPVLVILAVVHALEHALPHPHRRRWQVAQAIVCAALYVWFGYVLEPRA